MTVDLLAIGAHPDDVELGIGGTIHKLTQRGASVAMVDLTQGEMSTRGTIEERAEESVAAGRILGVSLRENARLPDGALASTTDLQRKVIPFIRKFRPKVLMAPMRGDRHPDHVAAHHLVRDANYFSGLKKIDTGQEPYRAPIVQYYRPYFEDSEAPQVVIDISENFEAKLKAIEAHTSQFFNPEYEGASTFISSKAFWDNIRVRAAYWGDKIKAAYGEPLFSDSPMRVAYPPGLEDTV